MHPLPQAFLQPQVDLYEQVGRTEGSRQLAAVYAEHHRAFALDAELSYAALIWLLNLEDRGTQEKNALSHQLASLLAARVHE
jgi:hypothetical protein